MTTPKTHQIPPLRRHKATNQAYVNLSGRRVYLGIWGQPETQETYYRQLAEWQANGCRLPVAAPEVTVVELCAAYWGHAKEHYRHPDGTATSELGNIQRALRVLKDLYGPTAAAEFGPLQLKAVRHGLIERELSRGVINYNVGIIRRMFKWGVSEAMVAPEVFGALQAVDGLRRGRSAARETEPVKPVPMAHVEAIQPFVSRQVWALIRLQLLTGARGGELLRLRPIDFDTSGNVWTVHFGEHKTRHQGRDRTLYLGPKAQAIVREFMADRPVDCYLFSPREAERERYDRAPTHRRSDQKANPTETTRVLGQHYTPASYRRAIEGGCSRADVPRWTPHRLRHNAGTAIRKEFGLEAAQVILGHSTANVTEIYAERDEERAIQVIEQVG